MGTLTRRQEKQMGTLTRRQEKQMGTLTRKQEKQMGTLTRKQEKQMGTLTRKQEKQMGTLTRKQEKQMGTLTREFYQISRGFLCKTIKGRGVPDSLFLTYLQFEILLIPQENRLYISIFKQVKKAAPPPPTLVKLTLLNWDR